MKYYLNDKFCVKKSQLLADLKICPSALTKLLTSLAFLFFATRPASQSLFTNARKSLTSKFYRPVLQTFYGKVNNYFRINPTPMFSIPWCL